ncbi:hypothetical protein ACHAWF_018789, partial [Thalassiosira exigua]
GSGGSGGRGGASPLALRRLPPALDALAALWALAPLLGSCVGGGGGRGGGAGARGSGHGRRLGALARHVLAGLERLGGAEVRRGGRGGCRARGGGSWRRDPAVGRDLGPWAAPCDEEAPRRTAPSSPPRAERTAPRRRAVRCHCEGDEGHGPIARRHGAAIAVRVG